MVNRKRKSMSIMNINWKLPEDIVKVIFSKLPFSNLPSCRIVCKAWNDLVLDYANSFSKFLFPPNVFIVCTFDVVPNGRLRNSYTCNPKIHCFDLDTVNFIATLGFDVDWEFISVRTSCNGLLQIIKSTCEIDGDIVVLNPVTKEFIELSSYEEDIYNFGFGFSPKTKQYKLFRIFDCGNGKLINTIEVWRFGISNKLLRWKPLISSEHFRIFYDGAYLDGVVYWVGQDTTNEFVIYGIDVETEVFKTIAILDVGPYSPKYYVNIQSFSDTIYLVISMKAPTLKMQVWIMRGKHSWIKEFVFDLSDDNRFRYHFIKADEGRFYFQVNNDLFYFDKTGKKIKIKTLFKPNKTKILSFWQMEALHFGSLPEILAGNR